MSRAQRWLLCVVGWLAAAPGWAVDPTTRHHGRFSDFEAGTGIGVALRSDGQLALGPTLTPFHQVDAQRIWSLAAAAAGLWIGTGDEGRVYRADSDTPRLLFDSPEIGIHTLEAGPDGVYAGTSPDGLVYHLTGDGTVTTFARSGSRYVWDLAHDHRRRLLVAAGGPARVLRIEGADVDTLFDARADGHVRSLAVSGERLFAGTAIAGTKAETAAASSRARIYEVTEAGGRLLVETEAEEVSHLAVLGDTLFAALQVTPPAQGAGSGPEGRATLLRVSPDGSSYALWRGAGTWAGLLSGDGWTIAVLREPTQVLRVRSDGRLYERVAHSDSLVPNAVALDGNGDVLLVGDGHTGRLSRLTATAVDSGHFDGRVEDLEGHAHWGALEWDASVPAGTRLFLRTRSGNTSSPDDTWSDWSAAISRSGTAIPSPAARYLQYRLVLSSKEPERTPQVRRVSFTARQTNLPPRIGDVTTFAYRGNPQGQGPPQPQANGGRNGNRRLPQSKSLRMVRWQAEDPNGDELSYRIYLRGEGQRDWKLVEEDIEQTSVFWDTETMPEGTTQLRVVASDGPDNPPELTLEDDFVSAPFPIDNTPPIVRLTSSREQGQIVIGVEIEDAVTAVHGARFAIDYGDASLRLRPGDGVFDSRHETATFRPGALPAGEHVISVQAWDALDNVGVARVLIEVE